MEKLENFEVKLKNRTNKKKKITISASNYATHGKFVDFYIIIKDGDELKVASFRSKDVVQVIKLTEVKLLKS